MAMVATRGQERVLAGVDEAAERAGLRAGMTATHAQSLVADLTLIDATPDDDHAGLIRLAHWCTRYAPLVTPDPPDGVFIDVAGSAHLFQGEAALIADLVERLQASRFAGRAAVADTPGAAWAVARFADAAIVSPGRQSEAIASLPVAALRLDPKTIEALRDVGIERVAQLASKPRATVTLRFGAAPLLRLDQALGGVHEALVSLVPPEVPRIDVKFVEPVADPDDLKRITQDLSDRMSTTLEERGVGARRLDLVFVRVDNIRQAVRVSLSRPNRDPKHMAKLLSDRLVLVDPGFGIESATLLASWVEALTERQTIGRHIVEKDSGADLGPLVDALTVQLGSARVFRAVPVESEIPERAVRKVAPLAPPSGLDWPSHLPRPPRLLSPPEPIVAIAEIPDYPPRAFIWRRIRYRIARADGPERVHGEWWISDAEVNLVRDYYRVETADGRRYWLFRDAPAEAGGRWWLHGMGDA